MREVFKAEFYQRLCIGRLRSHSFHSMRERTHENRGSSQEIGSNQVFHWWPVFLSWSGESAKEFVFIRPESKGILFSFGGCVVWFGKDELISFFSFPCYCYMNSWKTIFKH